MKLNPYKYLYNLTVLHKLFIFPNIRLKRFLESGYGILRLKRIPVRRFLISALCAREGSIRV